MTLTHCPLCVGLALLSVARATAHLSLLALLAWRRRDQSCGCSAVTGVGLSMS
jgi:hypothetical protein